MNNPYTEKSLQLSMAGRGDPWSTMSWTGLHILSALHDELPMEKILDIFEMDGESVMKQLQPMIDASLVLKNADGYRPAFFISNQEETRLVTNHARKTGERMGEYLLSQWNRIEQEYQKLGISADISLKHTGYMLVGGRILDIALLASLVRDRELLLAAPKRPAPGNPDAQYYFWMVEGEKEDLGKYGMDTSEFGDPRWKFMCFGLNMVNGKKNQPREDFEQKIGGLLESKEPGEIARDFGIPLLSIEDSRYWQQVSRQVADELLLLLKQDKSLFQDLYSQMASKRFEHSFGEFFCWYIHLSFAAAIDYLLEKKAFEKPVDAYYGLIMWIEGQEGLLVP